MSTVQPSDNIPAPLSYPTPSAEQQLFDNPMTVTSNMQPNMATSHNLIPGQHMALNRRRKPSGGPARVPHQQQSPVPALMLPQNQQPHTGAGPMHMNHQSHMGEPLTGAGPTNMNQPSNMSGPLYQNPNAISSIMPQRGMQISTRGDHRLMFSASDDNLMLKQIEQTHFPDGRGFDVKQLLSIVEDILHHAVPSVGSLAALDYEISSEIIKEKPYQASFTAVLETLAYLIDRICSEIQRRCVGGVDSHSITITILNMLSSFSWDAKLALALSAFAVNYGEFWLVAQSYTSNELAKSVAILKQLPEILENSAILKPQFDAIKNLVNAMIEISNCIVKFRELSWKYITPDHEAVASAEALTPVAVYWTIRSILACTSQLTGLTLLGREHTVSTSEAWELSNLAHKLNKMHEHFVSLLNDCYKYIEGKKYREDYEILKHLYFEAYRIDNLKILTKLFVKEGDITPLVDGVTKKRVGVEVLKRQNLLLLISNLDISHQEIAILEQIYNESRENPSRRESQYEVVWVPIVDPTKPFTEDMQRQFQKVQDSMPWHTVHHPSVLDRTAIDFIRKEAKFDKKPMLVVLDPQGYAECLNALHMMWIWGSSAFPFTIARQEDLWGRETWNLQLLVDRIDPTILEWIAEERYICLYGGEDIEWIRNFTKAANVVAQDAGIQLGMVYVGKSNPNERVRHITQIIAEENLSHYWKDLNLIWYFWHRLESMWYSKSQLQKDPEKDKIMHETIAILSYNGSEGGWALFSKGSGDITRAKGGQFLSCMRDFPKWQDRAKEDFMRALREHLASLHTPQHCNRLVLPSVDGTIPEKVACVDCGRLMEKFTMYRCCEE